VTAQELLHDLRSLGVALTTDGEELKLSAPAGTLTPERVSAIKRVKPALIQLLMPPEDQHGLILHCAALRVELLPDDARYLLALLPYPRKKRLGALNQYVALWQQAAEQEAVEHRKQNAGRLAANTWLRSLANWQ